MTNLVELIQSGEAWPLDEAEFTFGKAEVDKLIAEGKIALNPFSQLLEIARPTEDFFP